MTVHHLGSGVVEVFLRSCAEPEKHPRELRNTGGCSTAGCEGRFEGRVPSLDESVCLWVIYCREMELDAEELDQPSP